MVSLISTGNEELDVKLGGGYPHPSLILVEGGHGTGKTALIQQFVYGALKEGLRVIVFTTEVTVREFLRQMKEINMDVTDEFIKGLLRVYSAQIAGAKWIRRYASLLLPLVGSFLSVNEDSYDVAVIDSLSHLAVYARPSLVLDFISKARVLVSRGKTLILSLHPNTLREDLAVRLRAVCDGYIRLKASTIGGRLVKVMQVVKLRGAPPGVDTSISFDVDPAFGIKIIPIKVAQA